MRFNNNLIKEINTNELRKGGDSDIKGYLFSILNENGIKGLKNIQRYKEDFIKSGYNFDRIQKEVLYVWYGLKIENN
jgi:hypothetical protein